MAIIVRKYPFLSNFSSFYCSQCMYSSPSQKFVEICFTKENPDFSSKFWVEMTQLRCGDEIEPVRGHP